MNIFKCGVPLSSLQQFIYLCMMTTLPDELKMLVSEDNVESIVYYGSG